MKIYAPILCFVLSLGNFNANAAPEAPSPQKVLEQALNKAKQDKKAPKSIQDSNPGLAKWEARQMVASLSPQQIVIAPPTDKLNATERFEKAYKNIQEQSSNTNTALIEERVVKPKSIAKPLNGAKKAPSTPKNEIIFEYQAKQSDMSRFDQVNLLKIINAKPKEINVYFSADPSLKNYEMLSNLKKRVTLITSYLPKSIKVNEHYSPAEQENIVKVVF